MEERRRRKKMKMGSPSSPPTYSSLDIFSFDRTAFPLMLAAASAAEVRNPRSRSLLKCFLRAHLAILTDPTRSPLPPPVLLPRSLLSLLPLFLTSSFPALAALSAELVGAASLHSVDANLIIVSDEAIVNGLIRSLASRNRRIAMAACNAVLDLSASSIGRETLREFSAIEKLLWEGFIHIALHCWNQKKKQGLVYSIDSEIVKLRSVLVNMLHVAVRLIADKHSVFKKACLISALSYSPSIKLNHNEHFLAFKLKSTFDYIIETINDWSDFSMTFISIVTAVRENNEDYFQWMRWLRHLSQKEDEKVDFDNPLELFKEFVLLNNRGAKELMVELSEVKSEFCRSVVFKDAYDEFMALLEKYRKTRKQYMKGMLSLHMI